MNDGIQRCLVAALSKVCQGVGQDRMDEKRFEHANSRMTELFLELAESQFKPFFLGLCRSLRCRGCEQGDCANLGNLT